MQWRDHAAAVGESRHLTGPEIAGGRRQAERMTYGDWDLLGITDADDDDTPTCTASHLLRLI